MSEAKKWKLQGSYFETCNCETACPCVWLQAPTEGDCKLLVAWHIESGYLENQTLNNLNVALACYAPDNMKEGNWQAALYIDEQADDVQFEAITQIFSGQQGGHLAILMSFVSDVLGIKKVKIDYQEDGNKRFMSIPGIAQAEIEGIQGITGAESSISNPPLCVVSSHPSTVAKSRQYQYQDFDKNWQFSDRNGYYSDFIYQP
ncbi:hypothetical protein BMR07_11675 [Methylococcaceae bacterium CS1]|nr:DUF1326 domain-containing protein [Methyloprofundus sp.]TXK98783.1 hypothetical protein BMR10_01935 [Methylococcaceae bacterium CS4]TXK99113.1 hypothetical protein BMR11_07175 [Methylococcaceae bacterium CS5]TXL04763.1 hypothetical protein BMR07_11675 [Methylococcaceae bacterium CS1]TXL06653.1 hypothetical protein BMR09_07555 [Methylococcaceae bacterium CS3]TXL10781.1 hypothetical protein BMR08_07380 [Methylococcaceae bacterium CS2]